MKLLQGLHGSAFDLAYAKEVTATHATEIEAANAEVSNTLNAQARNLVTMMRDTLRQHLTAANEVAQKMGLPPAKETPQRGTSPSGRICARMDSGSMPNCSQNSM